MPQWVKNPTAGAPVAMEAQVQFPAPHSGLKDVAWLQLRHEVEAGAGIQSLACELPQAWGVAVIKKKKKKFSSEKMSAGLHGQVQSTAVIYGSI